jgi:hypothetical protein
VHVDPGGFAGGGVVAVTPGQARLGAVTAVVLGVLGVYLSKRPTTDIVAGVLAGMAFLYCAGSLFVSSRRDRRTQREQERKQETPWTMFSAPHPVDENKWEVGVRRRHDGVDLDRRVTLTVDANDELEIAVAEEQAKAKATRWTENKVGM